MENLSPSNDTLENDDDAHKGVMCARSTFFKTSDFPPLIFKLSVIWKILFLPKILLQMTATLTMLLCVLGVHKAVLGDPFSVQTPVQALVQLSSSSSSQQNIHIKT